MKQFSFFLFSILVSFLSLAADTLEIANLNPTWIYKNGDEWQPANSETKTTVIGFFVDITDQEDLFITVESSERLDVWVDKQLHTHATKKWIRPMHELAEKGVDQVFITLVSPKGFSNTECRIVSTSEEEVIQVGEITLSKRRKMSFENAFILSLILLIFFLGSFRWFFPITFSQIANWKPRLRKNALDDNFSGVINLDNLMNLFLLGLLGAINWVYFHFNLGKTDVVLSVFIPTFLNAFFISISLVLAKLALTNLTSRIFGFRAISGIHSLEYLHFSTFILIGLLVFVLIDFAVSGSSHLLLAFAWSYFVPAAILFFQIWIYFRLNRIMPNMKILIFSYLCISEFLLGFLLLVWILK